MWHWRMATVLLCQLYSARYSKFAQHKRCPRHPNTSSEDIWTHKSYLKNTKSQEVKFGCLCGSCFFFNPSLDLLSWWCFLLRIRPMVNNHAWQTITHAVLHVTDCVYPLTQLCLKHVIRIRIRIIKPPFKGYFFLLVHFFFPSKHPKP